MKNKPLFYRIYFTVIAVFLAVLVAGLCVLYFALRAYEGAQPGTVARNYFERYVETGDLLNENAPAKLSVSPYENRKSVEAALEKITAGKKLEYVPLTHSQGESAPRYAVTADGETFITLTLKRNGESGAFGIKGYTVAEVSLSKDLTRTVTVNAPSNIKLYVNGAELTDKPKTFEPLPETLKNLEGSENFALPAGFELEGMLESDPEIKAADANFTVTGENGVYTVTASGGGEICEYALKAAETYAAYMQEDMPFSRVAEFLDRTTDFYEDVRTTPTAFVTSHSGYAFREESYGSFHAYSENVCRCRVSFVQVLKKGAAAYEDRLDKYVYLKKTDGVWKVLEIDSAEARQ